MTRWPILQLRSSAGYSGVAPTWYIAVSRAKNLSRNGACVSVYSEDGALLVEYENGARKMIDPIEAKRIKARMARTLHQFNHTEPPR